MKNRALAILLPTFPTQWISLSDSVSLWLAVCAATYATCALPVTTLKVQDHHLVKITQRAYVTTHQSHRPDAPQRSYSLFQFVCFQWCDRHLCVSAAEFHSPLPTVSAQRFSGMFTYLCLQCEKSLPVTDRSTRWFLYVNSHAAEPV